MPGSKPQISILLPVFNADDTLEICLRSIIDQSFSDFELVAVDDGSRDRSGRILTEFAQIDPRFHIHHLDQNHGIVHALNFGLSRCTGTWVARMDADDAMRRERLEKQHHCMETHSGLDLIGAQVALSRQDRPLTDGQLHYEQWSNSLLSDGQIKESIFVESPIMHPTFFAPLDFFHNLGGYRDRPWPEDYDLLLRAYTTGKCFGKVAEILVDKRDSPNRLYRRDPRGKPNAMFRAKAHFLAKTPLMQKFGHCIIAGSGSSGRTAARYLAAEGVQVDGFIDHVEGPTGRTVMGLPTTNWMQPDAMEFFRRQTNVLFIVCIGNRQGRRSLVQLFERLGFEKERRYVRFL